MSSCFSNPRLGMLPRFGAKDSVSEVRFSSSTASAAVPSSFAYGRKMVLKPLPIQLPVNAASGPRGAGVTQTGCTVGSSLTAPSEKLIGEESAVASALASVIEHLSTNHFTQVVTGAILNRCNFNTVSYLIPESSKSRSLTDRSCSAACSAGVRRRMGLAEQYTLCGFCASNALTSAKTLPSEGSFTFQK